MKTFMKDDENIDSQPFMRWRDRFLWLRLAGCDPLHAGTAAGKPEGDPMTVQGHYNVCRDVSTLRDLSRGTCRAGPAARDLPRGTARNADGAIRVNGLNPRSDCGSSTGDR
jgi:hypothetical protein